MTEQYNKNKTVTARLLTLYTQIWMYQIIGLIIFICSRVIYLFTHTTTDNLVAHGNSLPLLVWNAWRFDIQAVTYVSLPAIVLALATPHIGDKASKKASSFMRYYYAVMLALLALLATAEVFFYRNFNSRYNVVFFDFFDEGPLGLLQTMWQDYPFLSILAGVVAAGCLVSLAGKYIQHIKTSVHRQMGTTATITASLLIIALTFIFMRGSVTQYTLQVEAFVVSTDEVMNSSVPNCIYMLKKAYKERKNSFKLVSDKKLLKENGFASIGDAIATAGLSTDSIATSSEDSVYNALFKRVTSSYTDKWGGKTHPNVLLILNESWSNHLLTMDRNDSLNILGAMRQHLKEDIYMKNIQSVRNGTIYTLETVAMGMPYMHFFNSRYRYESFNSSIAYPFKTNGYSTAFITGMDPTWENVLEGLMLQKFDTVIGRREVLERIDGSTTSEIGVYDEFLLQYILERMEKRNSSDNPQFVMALTTTNHPPFTYPENMQLPPLTDLWYTSADLKGDNDVLKKYGLGIQYTNESLGRFLDHFKQSTLARNTIIIITGDHNVRSILDYSAGHVPAEKRHAVATYIYLPPEYRPAASEKQRIEERYGSHYDLLPTLAPLAFAAGTEYLCLGNNLLDTTQPDSIYFSYNEKQTLSPNSEKNDSISRMMQARETLMKIYYQQHFRKQ